MAESAFLWVKGLRFACPECAVLDNLSLAWPPGLALVRGDESTGKTTLLRQILSHAQGKRIAVIVNEFGELGIDGELLRGCGLGFDESGADNGQLFELANGCLCCTVQEEFAPVM